MIALILWLGRTVNELQIVVAEQRQELRFVREELRRMTAKMDQQEDRQRYQ